MLSIWVLGSQNHLFVNAKMSKSNRKFVKCCFRSRTFYLHTGDIPIDTDLLIFLRIFSMDEGKIFFKNEIMLIS